jgi:hypothetical protein
LIFGLPISIHAIPPYAGPRSETPFGNRQVLTAFYIYFTDNQGKSKDRIFGKKATTASFHTFSNIVFAINRLRWLVTELSPRKPGFDTRPDRFLYESFGFRP